MQKPRGLCLLFSGKEFKINLAAGLQYHHAERLEDRLAIRPMMRGSDGRRGKDA